MPSPSSFAQLCVLAEVLPLIWEAALDEGQLSLADLTLLAQASLALSGLVPVEMLLARAPVENLLGESGMAEGDT